jgi:DNA-binding MarR family transcriptional regulator
MFWLLARAQRRMAAASDISLGDLDLTSTQAGALFCFRDEGLLIGELASSRDLAQSAASGLAKRLEEAGLVSRAEEKGDGRAARLKLTPVGKRKRDEAARRAISANAGMLRGFSDRDIDIVVRWLTHVSDIAIPLKRPSRQKEET